MTEGLSRYGYHLIFGKIDPTDLDDNWNWSRSFDNHDPVSLIQHRDHNLGFDDGPCAPAEPEGAMKSAMT